MSTQRGNVKKKGPPKYQNKMAFKNNMHDSSKRTQDINKMEVTEVCGRCKEIIEWKIKYKKYKPLTVPKRCTKCQQKTVKKAYYVICTPCAVDTGVCAKCGETGEPVLQATLSAAEESSRQSQLEQELKYLPERKRRTFLRLQASGELNADDNNASKSNNADPGSDINNSDSDTDQDPGGEDEME